MIKRYIRIYKIIYYIVFSHSTVFQNCELLQDEENDPEMQEYRKKMEEQKRLREKVLREKENRRKMAAMEKQNDEAKNEYTRMYKMLCKSNVYK